MESALIIIGILIIRFLIYGNTGNSFIKNGENYERNIRQLKTK